MTVSQHPLCVNCPTCQKKVVWSIESAYRPFCSERCRLIDLGEWVAEEKLISEPLDGLSELDLWQ